MNKALKGLSKLKVIKLEMYFIQPRLVNNKYVFNEHKLVVAAIKGYGTFNVESDVKDVLSWWWPDLPPIEWSRIMRDINNIKTRDSTMTFTYDDHTQFITTIL